MSKILIIEDDARVGDYISKLALGSGHVPLVATDPAGARRLVESEPDIALLIVDNNLGTGNDDGLAFLTAVRNSGKRHVPVIVCSGDTKPASVSAFLALNIVDFVKKPFRPERLLLDIERALGHAPAAAKRDAAMEVPARIIRGEG